MESWTGIYNIWAHPGVRVNSLNFPSYGVLATHSRTVHFDSAAQMLDFFHLSKDGRHYRPIVQAFHPVFAATIFFGTDDQCDRHCFVDIVRFHFFDEIHLWFHDDRQSTLEDDEVENTITLSEAFYKEIDAHRIPVERESIPLDVFDSSSVSGYAEWSCSGQSAPLNSRPTVNALSLSLPEAGRPSCPVFPLALPE